jgi:hypothetical protein
VLDDPVALGLERGNDALSRAGAAWEDLAGNEVDLPRAALFTLSRSSPAKIDPPRSGSTLPTGTTCAVTCTHGAVILTWREREPTMAIGAHMIILRLEALPRSGGAPMDAFPSGYTRSSAQATRSRLLS